MKRITCVFAAILLLVFVVRGVILPFVNRVGGGRSKDTETVNVQANTAGTSSDGSTEDASASADSATSDSSGDSSTDAVVMPIKGSTAGDRLSVMTPGWHEDSTGKWYQNPDGTYYINGFAEIDGTTYSFDENGYMQTGWVEKGVKDYYFNEDGSYDPSKKRPMIALTFDDGPGEYTEELINCLVENNAKATFFMLGQNVEAYPEIAKELSDAGMELGNHSYSHPDLVTIGAEAAAQQVSNTDAALKAATGFEATVMRPPGGSFNDSVKAAIDHPLIIWSIDTRDWATKSEDQTYQVVMDNAQDGSVVLMHDIHEWSVKAAIRMIPDLIAKGFKLVTVSELAEAKGKTLQSGNAYYYFGEGEQQVE